MQSIDFSQIRLHKGSQQNGFEELICQLASIQIIENQATFVSKDGSGGDAGIECFWTLTDGSEIGWQAKYFLNSLGSSEWAQITKSVEVALKKHPKLTKYYVCVPKNRTDSRKTYKGNPTKSEYDKWLDYEKKWIEMAHERNMNVDFIYLGESELTRLLIESGSSAKGLIEYWFNKSILTFESLETILEASKKSLGERYSNENNVDLPIEDAFHTIASDSRWRSRMWEFITKINDYLSKLSKWSIKDVFDNNTELTGASESLLKIENTLEIFKTDPISLYEEIDSIVEHLNIVRDSVSSLSYSLRFDKEYDNVSKDKKENILYPLSQIQRGIESTIDEFTSPSFRAGKEQALLIQGPAGSGKSHLLCDISIKRMEKNLPTIFLLGQHFDGTHPIDFLAKKLGIDSTDRVSVLATIDFMGKSFDSRVLIVIDAINEGPHRNRWKDYLAEFIHQIQQFSHISLVISCRDTYYKFIIPDKLIIPTINHPGFKGNVGEAARTYLAKYGIVMPNIPFLFPELTNPLFLKIVSQAFRPNNGLDPKEDMMKFDKLFDVYLEEIISKISKELNIMSDSVIGNAIREYTDSLFPDNIWGIDYFAAQEIFSKYYIPSNGSSLLDLLISEGLLSLDVLQNDTSNNGQMEVVRFTYERFSDYFFARKIMNNYSDVDSLHRAFDKDGEITKLLESEWKYRGVLEVISAMIPDKYSIEIYSLIENNEQDSYIEESFFRNYFEKSVLLRSKFSFSEETLTLLNTFEEQESYGYYSPSLDLLLRLSSEPCHPWNAEFLTTYLLKLSLAERDHFWTTHINIADASEDDEDQETPLRTILNWVIYSSLTGVDRERLHLLGLALMWFTSSSNRLIRQQATKALSKVLFHIQDEIISFIERFSALNDPYIVSSLYAAIYGAIVRIEEVDNIKSIVDSIPLELVLYGEHPDILLRDHVMGIFEYAISLGVHSVHDININYPLHSKAKFPLVIPSEERLDKSNDSYSSIKRSVLGFVGDFGKYTMTPVEKFSITPLSNSGELITYRSFSQSLTTKLSEEAQKLFSDYLKARKKEEDIEQQAQIDFLEKLASGNLSAEQMGDIWDHSYDDEQKEVNSEGDQNQENKPDSKQLLETFLQHVPKSQIAEIKSVLEYSNQDSVMKFDLLDAQHWVVGRAYELGWSKELFDDFESIFCGSFGQRKSRSIERVGKKYQWIAFYELLAILSDNYRYIDQGYADLKQDQYVGAWQFDISLREFDPTDWFNSKTLEELEKEDESHDWYTSPPYNQFPSFEFKEQEQWLWDTNSTPNLLEYISFSEEKTNSEWIILNDFVKFKKVPQQKNDTYYESQLWFRINPIIIDTKSVQSVIDRSQLSDGLQSPDLISIPKNDEQSYIWEFPWHSSYNVPIYEEYNRNPELFNNIDVLIPVTEYSWSTTGNEHIREESLDFLMPSVKLVELLNLTRDYDNPAAWKDNTDKVVFFDPSFTDSTRSKSLIKKDFLVEWLKDNQKSLLLLIGGEKNLYPSDFASDSYKGRLEFNAIYCLDETSDISETIWFHESKPK